MSGKRITHDIREAMLPEVRAMGALDQASALVNGSAGVNRATRRARLRRALEAARRALADLEEALADERSGEVREAALPRYVNPETIHYEDGRPYRKRWAEDGTFERAWL